MLTADALSIMQIVHIRSESMTIKQ